MKQWIYFKKYESSFALFSAALAIIMLGLSYISVPLYQIFCQTYGIGGTVQKINYNSLIQETDELNSIDKTNIAFSQNKQVNNLSLKDKPLFLSQQKHKVFSLDNQENLFITPSLASRESLVAKEWDEQKNLKSITVYLSADNSQDLPWILKPSISKVKVYPGDTALIFYVAQNLSNQAITGVATYNIVPAKAGIYFNKIQCFCFEEQRLKGNESIELPVLFFIDSEFLKDPKMNDVDSLTLSYTFFKTNDLFLE